VIEPKPSRSRATLRQVAARAGVSVKTASRALNGEPYVSSDTLTRVNAAAADLRFRVNAVARDFRTGARSPSVGLLIGDLANPFYARLARGAERHLHASGLRLVTASTEESAVTERELVDEMLERRMTGIMIVTSADHHPYVESEQYLGTPIVFVDRAPADIVADAVVLDNAGGMATAVEHLVSFGHERIGLLSHARRLSSSRERVEAFESAMAEAGLDGEPYTRTDCDDADSATHAATDLLTRSDPPTALIATNNRLAIGALKALRLGNFDAAFIGFDDFELSDLLGTSVVAHDPEAMGAAAAEFVIDRIEGDTSPARTLVLPTTLIARQSSMVGPKYRCAPRSGPCGLPAARPSPSGIDD
jgi:LacI family transcriptional regulator